MVCFLFFLLLSVVTFASNDTINSFLEFIFDSENFSSENYSFGNSEMIFSYQYRPSSNIFYKALILHNTFPFQPLLYISLNKIISPSGQVIFVGCNLTQPFFGWSIHVVERNNAFSLNYYSNNGRNVTEGPTILWDNRRREFTLYNVDRSQW